MSRRRVNETDGERVDQRASTRPCQVSRNSLPPIEKFRGRTLRREGTAGKNEKLVQRIREAWMWPRWNFPPPLFFSNVLTKQLLDVYTLCAMGQIHSEGSLVCVALLYALQSAACYCVRVSCIYAGRSMINSCDPSGSVLLLHLRCRRLGHL